MKAPSLQGEGVVAHSDTALGTTYSIYLDDRFCVSSLGLDDSKAVFVQESLADRSSQGTLNPVCCIRHKDSQQHLYACMDGCMSAGNHIARKSCRLACLKPHSL